jgi:hypothetical protein
VSAIETGEKVPNNVALADDRALERALEQWQPNNLQWWAEMGPEGSTNFDVYLRTAVSVDPQGWARFGVRVAPDGRVVADHEWNAMVEQWLPTDTDRAFVASLMGRVVEPGRFAGWIAPPALGINRQPAGFEYVRFN